MARKKRGSPRKSRRAPSRGLLIGVIIVLTGVAVLVARTRTPLTPGPPREAEEPSARPILVNSDWDRFRLRMESEFLRTVRAGDRAALLRLTSRTLRGALQEIGIDKDRIEERVVGGAGAGAGRAPGTAGPGGPAAAAGARAPSSGGAAGSRTTAARPAPIQWHIEVPRRASLYRINDALTQAIQLLGGHVLRGVERPAPLAGVLLDLRLGFNDQATHAIVVEPSGAIADQGAQIALVVTGLDRVPISLYRSFLRTSLPYSAALKPDRSKAGWIGRDLRGAKHEILLHLPMEPKGYPRVDPGRDAILLDLSRIEIEDRIARCLSVVGPVRGVVSRLGSAALNDTDVMRAVLDEVKRRDLPFIDAHGAGPSVVDEIGEETGARTIMVAAVLDASYANATAVRARLRGIIAMAAQRGSIVVTVKPSALVLSVLESEAPKLKELGVEFVPISRLTL